MTFRLFPNTIVETPDVLRQLIKSHKYLAELKAIAKLIPNENILISTLTLREAKDSSEIENIVTTHDDLYKESISINTNNPATKEVIAYAKGLRYGFEVVKNKNLLLNRDIIKIQEILEKNNAGFRTQMGTKLLNNKGEVVYTPPQNYDDILNLMSNLEKFINDNSFYDLDPLVKMAIIHYQFESIHPFYDGNGRTGRIINILYLVLQGLLDYPILYLSRYIIKNKAEYYNVLQNVRTKNDWESLILYFLKSVEETAKETIDLILEIKTLMQYYKHRLRKELSKIYSQELLNVLFKEPYIKTEFLERELIISKRTALNHLNSISKIGLLDKIRIWKTNYYLNTELLNLLTKNK